MTTHSRCTTIRAVSSKSTNPYFAMGLDYVPPSDAQFGQKATMFYDPRGQVIRTRNPDGSEQRVIYGIPVR